MFYIDSYEIQAYKVLDISAVLKQLSQCYQNYIFCAYRKHSYCLDDPGVL
jgi:hypothetical protein